MGWTGIDDFVSEITAGKFYRADWQKNYAQAAATAGRWYDLGLSAGNPGPFGFNATAPNCGGYGELVRNGGFQGGYNFWTLADAGWVWTNNTMTHVAAVGTGTLSCASMQKPIVAGRSYRVTTVVSTATNAAIGVTIGGTAGVDIPISGAAQTNVQVIPTVAGAGLLTYTPRAIGLTGTITYVSVVELLQAFPLDDTLQGSLYHGGNVAGSTKHLINAGAVVTTGTTAPSTLILVDLLMAYPGIQYGTGATQTFLNTGGSLPRYTSGVGVKAFMVTNTVAGAASPSILLRYTNTTGDDTRTLPSSPLMLTGSPVQHIPHSGVVAGSFGPFLPWQDDDLGMVSAYSIRLSATMTSGEGCLVLCKPLATIPITTQYIMAERDYFNQLPSLPRIYDGACLGLLLCAGAAVPNPGIFMGYMDFAWG